MEKELHVLLEYRNWLETDGVGRRKQQSGTHENVVTDNEEAVLPCPTTERFKIQSYQVRRRVRR